VTLSPRDVAAGDWTLRSELPSSRLVTHGPAGFDQYVDPHWAGIGGTRHLVSRLVTDPRLDVVPADPTQEQPAYG
jgi:hypothetical protein